MAAWRGKAKLEAPAAAGMCAPDRGQGWSQGGSGRHASSSSSMKLRTFGDRCRLEGYTARIGGPSASTCSSAGSRRPARRSSLIRKVASRAIPYPASVASRSASALVAANRPLIATERDCPLSLNRHSTGRPPWTKARQLCSESCSMLSGRPSRRFQAKGPACRRSVREWACTSRFRKSGMSPISR